MTWWNIKNRCTLPKATGYKNYGGRGIVICDRWMDSFLNFYKDMGSRPSDKHSIERIDVNGNYEPNNCMWATREEQAVNRRNNVIFECNGLKKILRDWADYFNTGQGYLHKMIKRDGIDKVYQFYLNKYKELPYKGIRKRGGDQKKYYLLKTS